MSNFDPKVLDCFLKNQLQLFPEPVAETPEEADEFLEMMFAVVVKGKRSVRRKPASTCRMETSSRHPRSSMWATEDI